MAARIPVALLLAGLLAGCSFPGASSAPAIAYAARNARWVPSANATYQIQYDGKLDLSVSAEVYDVDAFDTTAHQVAAIHTRARRAVCYVDVGTWEKWRPDASQFPKSVLGLPDGGWPGERWLDIRQTSVL
ncbi:MAG TPA: endo alpha-1,4 polygalactosaminidase, partial [Candidatus Baltobacteraceae bacterium]|nr:endo alpha-1,4 polygalactosaminidase [Candidatus Baltobacteraceae bacterium]